MPVHARCRLASRAGCANRKCSDWSTLPKKFPARALWIHEFLASSIASCYVSMFGATKWKERGFSAPKGNAVKHFCTAKRPFDSSSAGGIFLCPAAALLSGEKGRFAPDISKRPRYSSAFGRPGADEDRINAKLRTRKHFTTLPEREQRLHPQPDGIL